MATRQETDAKDAEARRLIALGMQARNSGDMSKMGEYFSQAQTLRGEVTAESGRHDIADFGTSALNAARNVSDNVQSVMQNYGGTMGQAFGDTLSRINAGSEERAKQKVEQDAINDRSPRAAAFGRGAGETAVTLPLAGLGLAGRTLVTGARTADVWNGVTTVARNADPGIIRNVVGAATGLSTEGAAIGAITTQDGESALERAGVGAAANLVVGGGINAITTGAGQLARNRLNSRSLDLADQARLNTNQQTIDEAAMSGGYTLDPLTADHSIESIAMRDQLKLNPDTAPTWARNTAQVEKDVTAKAESIVGMDGLSTRENIGGGVTDMTRVVPVERRLSTFKSALDEMVSTDRGEFKALYSQADALAAEKGVKLDLAVIKKTESLVALIDDPSMKYGGNAAAAKGVLADLREFGLVGPSEEATGRVSSIQKRNFTSEPAGPGTPLTFENSEHLIQSLNSRMAYDGSAGDRLIGKAKAAVMDAIDESLSASGLDSEVVSTYRAASAARRSFNKNWEQSDLIGNVVNVKRNVEDEFKLDYAKILGKLDRDSVKKIKAKIGLGDKNPEAWASIRQAPLLEALAAGTGERQTAAVGNVTTFNDTAFFKVLDRYSIEVKEELWGKEVVDQLDRARSAWLMRNRKIESTSSANPSGTAAATELMRSGRFMASGPSRNIGMALNSIFGDRAQKYSINKAAERATREAVDENILPTEIIDNTRIASLMDLESNYLGTHGAKYMQALQSATRIFGLNMAVDAKTKK